MTTRPTESTGDELREAVRERDALWCKALISCLNTDDIQRVTATMLKMRDASGAVTLHIDQKGGGVMQYRKTALVEAVQFTREIADAYHFDGGALPDGVSLASSKLFPPNRTVHQERFEVKTLEGFLSIAVGDWVLCGNNGEHWPVRSDIFESTYEPVTSPQPAAADGEAREAWIQEGRELMRDPITMVRCREWAAQAWCNEETGDIEMDSRLANAFAGILYGALTRESPK